MKKIFFVSILLLTMCAFFIGSARAELPISVSLFNPIQVVDEDDSVKGLRFNLIYGANHDVTGIDAGFINRTYGTQKGFQIGIFNNVNEFHGLQIGLINRVQRLDGMQFGLANIHYEADNKGFVPFFNFKF